MPLLGSKPVPRGRRGDEMIEISAPLTWVEASDPPRKGAEENLNRSAMPLLSDFRPKKPQDINTKIVTDIRIVYVFVLSYTPYFHIVEVKYG